MYCLAPRRSCKKNGCRLTHAGVTQQSRAGQHTTLLRSSWLAVCAQPISMTHLEASALQDGSWVHKAHYINRRRTLTELAPSVVLRDVVRRRTMRCNCAHPLQFQSLLLTCCTLPAASVNDAAVWRLSKPTSTVDLITNCSSTLQIEAHSPRGDGEK